MSSEGFRIDAAYASSCIASTAYNAVRVVDANYFYDGQPAVIVDYSGITIKVKYALNSTLPVDARKAVGFRGLRGGKAVLECLRGGGWHYEAGAAGTRRAGSTRFSFCKHLSVSLPPLAIVGQPCRLGRCACPEDCGRPRLHPRLRQQQRRRRSLHHNRENASSELSTRTVTTLSCKKFSHFRPKLFTIKHMHNDAVCPHCP